MKRSRRKSRRLFSLIQKFFGCVAFIGLFGLVGTAGSSDLNTISLSDMAVQMAVFGGIFLVGLYFSGVHHYHYDPKTGEEWLD